MTAPGSPRGGVPSGARTWLQRRAVYPITLATLALAGLGQTVTTLFWTPQFSGADAPVTLKAAAAAVAGACFAGLISTLDPITEARAVRNVRTARRSLAAAILCLGTLAFGATTTAGWDWPAARTYAFIATAMMLVTRYAGTLTAALTFAAYLGACFFVGVPIQGQAHWWAVPMQPASGFSTGMAVLAVAACTAVMLTFRNPPLPQDHRRGPLI